jgi:hypothetical protein
MKFKLEIAMMGNDIAQWAVNVAAALRVVAEELETERYSGYRPVTIMDTNGNSVGTWRITGKRSG